MRITISADFKKWRLMQFAIQDLLRREGYNPKRFTIEHSIEFRSGNSSVKVEISGVTASNQRLTYKIFDLFEVEPATRSLEGRAKTASLKYLQRLTHLDSPALS